MNFVKSDKQNANCCIKLFLVLTRWIYTWSSNEFIPAL